MYPPVNIDAPTTDARANARTLTALTMNGMIVVNAPPKEAPAATQHAKPPVTGKRRAARQSCAGAAGTWTGAERVRRRGRDPRAGRGRRRGRGRGRTRRLLGSADSPSLPRWKGREFDPRRRRARERRRLALAGSRRPQTRGRRRRLRGPHAGRGGLIYELTATTGRGSRCAVRRFRPRGGGGACSTRRSPGRG